MSDRTADKQRPWRTVLPTGVLLKLRDEPSFHELLCLARACNVLRFSLEAGTAIQHENAGTTNRQQLNTYLVVAAALSEALRLCERLDSQLHHVLGYAELKAF